MRPSSAVSMPSPAGPGRTRPVRARRVSSGSAAIEPTGPVQLTTAATCRVVPSSRVTRSALASAASVVDHSIFPTDCLQCHAPFSWSGGVTFDHAVAAHGFRLDGAHASLRCMSCHLQTTTALRFSPRPTGSGDNIGESV